MNPGTGGTSGGGMNPGTGGTSGGGMNPGTGGTSGGGDGGTSGGSSGGDASVLQYHKNASRDGMYVESAFTRAAAATLKADAGFAPTVDRPDLRAAAVLRRRRHGKDLVIVATETEPGQRVQRRRRQHGLAEELRRSRPRSSLPCGNIDPLGITGTPVIDPRDASTLYFDAMTRRQAPST